MHGDRFSSSAGVSCPGRETYPSCPRAWGTSLPGEVAAGSHAGITECFSRACCDRTRGNGFKLKEGKFRLGVRKKFFTARVVKPWHRLSGEVVDAPSLERPDWMGL